jgi:hypothetical protein
MSHGRSFPVFWLFKNEQPRPVARDDATVCKPTQTAPAPAARLQIGPRQESFMNRFQVLPIAVALVLSSHAGWAQDLSRYRAYVLDSSLASVLAASGTRAPDAKTLHERPAKIQELEWRAPYGTSRDDLADPVRGAVFSFCDDALYQIVVTYDPGRTNGLTNGDVIESLTAVYGEPVPRSARTRPPAARYDAVVLTQWDGKDASLTLLRGTYGTDFQLILMSKATSARARSAMLEAGRLDAIEAPRRELEQRKKDAADAAAAREKVRTTNKAAFRP